MRTLHVDTELVWRGGQQQVLLLLEGLERRGVQVKLAAPGPSPLFSRARPASIAAPADAAVDAVLTPTHHLVAPT